MDKKKVGGGGLKSRVTFETQLLYDAERKKFQSGSEKKRREERGGKATCSEKG